MSYPDPLSSDEYRPLPLEAHRICNQFSAPPRLCAHLVLVHDTACSLIDQIHGAFPRLRFDAELVRFGAAVHDIGKSVHREELTEFGKEKHQKAGVEILESLGLPYERARFAFTHANWDGEEITVEDLLVALADKCWKRKRIDKLESLTAEFLSTASGEPTWECYAKLDEILQSLAQDADKRLAWQASFGL